MNIVASQESAILEDIRVVLKRPDIEFSTAPERISGGYDTDIIKVSFAGLPASMANTLVIRSFPPRISGIELRPDEVVP